MRKVFFPIKDATIYSELTGRNTGLDEQIEVGKSLHGSKAVRALMQFDTDAIIAAGIPITATYDLILYTSFAENLKDTQGIEVSPLSQSWNAGTGKFYDDVIQENDGVTWLQRDSGSLWTTPGGDILSAPTASIRLPKPMGDLTFDVTSLIRSWLSGSANNGVVVRFPSGSEANGTNLGLVRFFSAETKTIYRPSLIAKWNDQVYITGSLSAAPSDGLFVIPATLKPIYNVGEVVRVDIAARAQYPLKTFSTATTAYTGNKYLPSSSYYSIVDDQAGTVIVPFSDSTLVSCDTSGNYIKFAIENMYTRRFYRVLIKVDSNGLSQIFDTAALFTVK
jgi:hypothetical protein